MLIKLIYLVRNQLTLIKVKSRSLSRKIGFPDRARIIEFALQERRTKPQDVGVASCSGKVKVSCHNNVCLGIEIIQDFVP